MSTHTHAPTQAAVEREEFADSNRGDSPPDVETVFSQVRNGRLKRLEDSLEKGFLIDTEDEYGNTALMVACQVCTSSGTWVQAFCPISTSRRSTQSLFEVY